MVSLDLMKLTMGGGQNKGELLPTAQDEDTLSWH